MMQNFEIEWVVRILCAMIAGTIIGQERQNKSKEAGARTHAIVAISACLLMIISKSGFADTEKFDAARIAAQVVSGVGFLGAGLIFVRNDFIQGLTTAAGIWATSAIGLCFGSGMYLLGTIVSVLMYFIQAYYHTVFQISHLPRSQMTVRLYLTEDATAYDISQALQACGYQGTEYRFHPRDGGYIVETAISTFENVNPAEFIKAMESEDKIVRAEMI